MKYLTSVILLAALAGILVSSLVKYHRTPCATAAAVLSSLETDPRWEFTHNGFSHPSGIRVRHVTGIWWTIDDQYYRGFSPAMNKLMRSRNKRALTQKIRKLNEYQTRIPVEEDMKDRQLSLSDWVVLIRIARKLVLE